MLDRIIALLRRLTRWELATLVAFAVAPFLVLVALAASAWPDDPIVAIAVTAYLVVVIALSAVSLGLRGILRSRFVHARDAVRPARRSTAPSAPRAPRLLGDARVLDAASRLPRRAIHNFGVRTQSTWAREVLAYRATDGRLDFPTLMRAIRAADGGDRSVDRLLLGKLDHNALVDLVRMMSGQFLQGREQTWYESMLGYLGAQGAKLDVVHEQQLVLAERLVQADRVDLARGLVERWATRGVRERMLAADILNPALRAESATESRTRMWLGAFNQVFRTIGIEPVVLRDEGPTLFDRLDARASERVAGGPLITVIMTCFRPDESLVTAVRSVVRQSWANWELLVMDDASPVEHGEVLDRVAELDPRVRVIRATRNAGTYVRRNDALREAQGEFVTMHDSDDWVHPRRLELQVADLLAVPTRIANLSESARVSEDLAFTQARGTKLRPAETSILFRRADVLERIGFYDDVRKAADSEYRLRMEAAFGMTVPILPTDGPLTLVRYLPQSLSGSDFRDGWVHPSRIAYRSASWAWHDRIREGSADPRLPHPLVERPFVAPARLLGAEQGPRELDLVVLLDGRATASPPEYLARLAEELARLAATRTVGIHQIDALCADAALGVTARPIQELVDAGTVERVLDGEIVTAGAVLVRNASLIQGLEPSSSTIATERVVVLEDESGGRDRLGRDFARSYVTRTLAAMFGTSPDYVKAGDHLDLAALLAPDESRTDDGDDAAAIAELSERFQLEAPLADGTGWAARGGTLRALVDAALELPPTATIVEAGSGRSTFWLALAAARAGRRWRIVSLEHEHRFAEETRALLADHGLAERAEVVLAPLEDLGLPRGLYSWYGLSALDGLRDVGLLFVDGPPSSVGVEARYPAFPVLREALSDGCLIVVDDAQRHDERAIIHAWLEDDRGEGRLELERYEGRAAFLRFRR